MSSRAAEKQKRREEREQREHQDAAKASKGRRLRLLAGVGAGAVVVVVALVLLGGGPGKDSPKGLGGSDSVAGAADANKLLTGIPQKGAVLGKPGAPVTMVEYVDLQCPFCRDFSVNTLPTLIRDYVRTGKLRIEQRTLRFIGDDSGTAAGWAAAAAQDNRLFQFSEVFFRNQGEENTGYVTSEFLTKIARAAELDPAKAETFAQGHRAEDFVVAGERQAQALGVESTPSFALGKTGSTLQKLNNSSLDVGAFTGPIDKLLSKKS